MRASVVFHHAVRALVLTGGLVLLAGCGPAQSNAADGVGEAGPAPGGLPPPGARSDLRQLRFELTYGRDARLRAPHRGEIRDVGEHTFRLRVSYDALVELAPPPEGTTWPEVVPTGTFGPVRGEVSFAGTHRFIEDAGQPPVAPARLEASGLFAQPEEIEITLAHLVPYTDQYVATVRFDLPVRPRLSGPMPEAAVVAGMMLSPFSLDHDEPGALRLAAEFTVYPGRILPRPADLDGALYDMQERTISRPILLGALLGVAWRGAELSGQPRGDWTYTLQGDHTTGGEGEHEFHDRVALTIRTVPVTLVPPGRGDIP